MLYLDYITLASNIYRYLGLTAKRQFGLGNDCGHLLHINQSRCALELTARVSSIVAGSSKQRNLDLPL